MKHSIELFLGSCAVYVIVAACSSGGSIQNTASLGGSTNSSSMVGSSGTMGTSNGSGGTLNGSGGGSVALSGGSTGNSASTIIDAGPVPDAMAQTDSGASGPQVNTAACDTTITVGSSPGVYAVMSYPGRTATQLARLQTIGVLVTPTGEGTHKQEKAWVEDGKARVSCGIPSVKVYSSVIFVLP